MAFGETKLVLKVIILNGVKWSNQINIQKLHFLDCSKLLKVQKILLKCYYDQKRQFFFFEFQNYVD